MFKRIRCGRSFGSWNLLTHTASKVFAVLLVAASVFIAINLTTSDVASAAGGGAERFVMPIDEVNCFGDWCEQNNGELVMVTTPSGNMIFLLHIDRIETFQDEAVSTGVIKVRTLTKLGFQHKSHEMASTTYESGCTVKYMVQWNHGDVTFQRDFNGCEF
jgi:hypothetical protein